MEARVCGLLAWDVPGGIPVACTLHFRRWLRASRLRLFAFCGFDLHFSFAVSDGDYKYTVIPTLVKRMSAKNLLYIGFFLFIYISMWAGNLPKRCSKSRADTQGRPSLKRLGDRRKTAVQRFLSADIIASVQAVLDWITNLPFPDIETSPENCSSPFALASLYVE